MTIRAIALATLAALAACSGGPGAVQPLPPPPSTAARPPTSAPVDYSGVALPAVPPGRTTTTAVVMGPGNATLEGKVLGPDGAPVEGATVRVERMVGGAVATTDVGVGRGGEWTLPAVLGGGYRIRAWRVPDLALVTPAFFFVGAGEKVPVELKVEKHFGTTPAPALSPSRPMVGQPAKLVVQLTSRSVDTAGVVQGTPKVGISVELVAGTWAVGAPNPTVTDASGRARWELVCGLAGTQPLRLVVAGGEEQFQLALPGCVDPPTPPPTAPGSSTAPAAPTTTRPVSATTTTSRPPLVVTTTTRPAPTTTRPPTTTTTRPPTTTTTTTRPRNP